MPRALAVLASLPLTLAAPAQDSVLQVGDLVLPRPVEVEDFEPPAASSRWIGHLAPPQDEAWESAPAFAGEWSLLADAVQRPWFTADELVDAVAHLAQTPVAALECSGAELRVAPEDSAAVSEALLWIRRHLPPIVAVELTLERLDGGARTTLLRAVEPVRAGTTAVFADTVTRSVIRDFDVEIAQASVMANPVVAQVRLGACAALRVRLVPGEARALVETVVRVAAGTDLPSIDVVHGGVGGIDRAARAIEECGLGFALERGAATVHEWTGAGGSRLRLSCTATWDDPPPGPRDDVRIRCSGLFQDAVLTFEHLEWPGAELPELDDSVAVDLEPLEERGGQRALVRRDAETATGKVVWVGGDAATVDRELARRFADVAASVPVTVDVFDVPIGGDASAGRRVAGVATRVLVGRWATFGATTECNHLPDWEVEVAQSARVPDPICRPLAFGSRIALNPTAPAMGVPGRIALRLSLSRLVALATARVHLDMPSRAGGIALDSGAVEPAIVLPQDTVGIEQPELAAAEVDVVLRLAADGSAELRRSAARLLGDGRELLVRVRAGG